MSTQTTTGRPTIQTGRKAKTVRAARPARLNAGARGAVLTAPMWRRLGELPARIRARDERLRKRLYRASNPPPYTAGDKAYYVHMHSDRRHIIGIDYLAAFLRIPKASLLAALSGEAFYMDFGRSWRGGRIQIARIQDLVRFAKAQLRVRQ